MHIAKTTKAAVVTVVIFLRLPKDRETHSINAMGLLNGNS